MRILVAIANHGTKNRSFCEHLISVYQRMDHDIDIVVLSDTPKEYGLGVEVLVGAPTEDPWSLPFAHRPIFRSRRDDYDLFIYTEDDTEIRQSNIELFLDATKSLPPDRVLGFLRYELADSGELSFSTVHHTYHWQPESVLFVDGRTYASYTNHHSGSYILTRGQLKSCIESGGFQDDPHATRYDMLVSAATDVYTQCGLEKVICVSDLMQSSLHHLPNVYLDRIGVSQEEFVAQVDQLLAIDCDSDTSVGLFDPMTKMASMDSKWDKRYYEPVREPILDEIGLNSCRVLSVGCERGATERRLVQSGHDVLAVPIDEIIAATARVNGIETLTPDLAAALEELRAPVDVALFNCSLSYFADPVSVLHEVGERLSPAGKVIVAFDNMEEVGTRRGRRRSERRRVKSGPFSETGVHWTTAAVVRQWLAGAGLDIASTVYEVSPHRSRLTRWLPKRIERQFGAVGVVVGDRR